MEKQNACNLQIFHDIILFPQIHNAPLHLEPSKKKPVDFNQFFWSGLSPEFQNEYWVERRLSLLRPGPSLIQQPH